MMKFLSFALDPNRIQRHRTLKQEIGIRIPREGA